MKRYIIHVHTNFSKCSTNKPENIINMAKNKGLDGIAITDHNSIKGAKKVKELNKNPNFEVIIGEEVETDIGHILVLYVKKEIKPGKIENVIKEAKKQNALIILAHPYNKFTEKISKLGIKARKSIKEESIVKQFDAIEVFNARCSKSDNNDAQNLAEKYNKPMVAGSDAHFLSEIMKTYIEFDDKYSFKEAITKNKITFSGNNKYALLNRLKSFFIKTFT